MSERTVNVRRGQAPALRAPDSTKLDLCLHFVYNANYTYTPFSLLIDRGGQAPALR